MRSLTKSELGVMFVTLAFIAILSLLNFQKAIRRSRDNVRKDDINYVRNQLVVYRDEAGFLPLSTEDGAIKACAPENIDQLVSDINAQKIMTKEYLESLVACPWGDAKLVDFITGIVYIENLPKDPRWEDGSSYRYISNGRLFQLLANLEGVGEEVEIKDEIIARNIACGSVVCNFGRGYEKTPLDKTLEEYENELAKEKNK